MALIYRIDTTQGLVVSRGWGTLTDRDLALHQRALGRDPDFDASMSQLLILEELDASAATSNGVRHCADLDPFDERARRAIVVRPGQLVTFGIMRMFAALSTGDDDEVRVQFDHLAQAEAWLEIGAYELPDGQTGRGTGTG